MSKLKIVIAITFVALGMVAVLAIRHQSNVIAREKEQVFSRQNQELAELSMQHERLLKRAADAKTPASNPQMPELEKLRSEVEQLRQQTNEFGKKLARSAGERRLLHHDSIAPPGFEYNREYDAQREALTTGREKDAEALSKALWDYYRKHQQQLPSSLDQLAPYLAENHLALTGTNDFELIYPGPQNGLTNFPTQMLAVLRERVPWQAPSGRMARVYGMLTHPPTVVETIDNFQSWEVEHIIPPKSSDQ